MSFGIEPVRVGISRRFRSVALLSASLPALLCAAAAHAQTAPAAPVRATVDGNGVDLFSGTLNVDAPSMSLGDGSNGLEYHRWNKGSGWSDDVTAFLNLAGTVLTVSIGEVSDSFTVSGTTYTSTEGNGSTLTLASNVFTYTRSDGTVAHFNKTFLNEWSPYGNSGVVTDIVNPNGEKTAYTYGSIQYCATWKPGGGGNICTRQTKAYRISEVTNNYGYRLVPVYDPAFEYFYDSTAPEVQPDFAQWYTVIGMNARNAAASTGPVILAAQNFATTTTGATTHYVVTDSLARQTKFRMGGASVLGITRPGSTAEDVTVTWTAGKVTAIASPAGTTSYAYSDAAPVRTVTVTDPGAHATVYTFNIPSKRLTSIKDPLNNTTSFQYDASGRLTRTTYPEGNYVQLTLDSRGNVTETRQVSKTPGTPPDIVTTAGYPASCTSAASCNQPLWTKDALGNQTDYTYDPVHGGVLTVTSPAAAAGGIRPQVRYSYSSLQAYYSTGGGAIVASGQPVTRLTGTSTCLTSASCAGTAEEAKTTVSYGPQTAGVGNNLLPVSVTRASGDGAISATTTVAYDPMGNATYVDGPLPGAGDTSAARYDALRRPVGSIAPDPDGAGPLVNAASRITYDVKGRVTLAEQGTTNGQSDTAWAAFTPATSQTATYDAADRVVTQAAKDAAGATVQLTQNSYDAHGRLDCSAVRMNPATFASLPSSACNPATQGNDGPDRIVKYNYDNDDRPSVVFTAVGTADETLEAVAYSPNGRTTMVRDAENNLTTTEYDGHDRPVKTRLPVPTKGANASSNTDYVQQTYNANSQVTDRRLRDGTVIGSTYDNLGRATALLVGGNPARIYGYNLLGQKTSASWNGGGSAEAYSYDALGRMTQHAQPYGSLTYQYDAAGRRTRLTWADGLFIQYDYNAIGNVTAIRENGATSGAGVLAQYSYDSLGRRIGIVRGNGNNTGIGYDPAGNLLSIGHDFPGTASDVGWGYGYNPAGQLKEAARSNDAYAWGGHYTVNRPYTSNGLNQLTTAGATALTYDARGNLSGSGANTYSYDAVNDLTAMNGTTLLQYGARLQLQGVGSASSATMFGYDGPQISSEWSWTAAAGASLLRRYVPGPGTDEPIVWYEGAGTADRRWLHADERGSVVSVSDAGGNVIAINRYDEYGIPAATNLGRFQYTGQAWLPELGMYYYKARMYSPTLGRFMQTDPIGYGDGLNWYNYVGSDPVNFVDPTGLVQQCDPAVEGQISVCATVGRPCPNGTVSVGGNFCIDFNLYYGGHSPGEYQPGGVGVPPPPIAPGPQSDNCQTSGVNDLVKNHKNLADAVARVRANQASTENEFGFEAQVNGRAGVSVSDINQGIPGEVTASKWFTAKNALHLNFGALYFHSHGPGYIQNLSEPDVRNGDGFGEAMTVLITPGGLQCSRSKM